MPRSNRPRRPQNRAGGPQNRAGRRRGPAPDQDLERARSGIAERQSAPDGEWMVRSISAQRASKVYACPGCGRSVLPGTAHVVVWREDSLFGATAALEDRRHWHTHCWSGRSFRRL